jgi:hypothetical protein
LLPGIYDIGKSFLHKNKFINWVYYLKTINKVAKNMILL